MPSPARALFATLARGPEAALDMARAALLIAVEDDLDWAVETGIARLDELADGLSESLAGRAPWAQLELLATHVQGRCGFEGNRDDYYDPRNSLLTQVLARRTGIPITLALVYMEVARRHGVTLEPIGLPGHLVVRHARDHTAFLDPFFGDVLTEEECRERVLGADAPQPLPASLFQPLAARQFVLRLLHNLKGAYLRHEPPHPEGALAACERILLLYPDRHEEVRDRGLLLLVLERRIAALECLERYLHLAPDAQDAERMRAQATAIYRALSRLN